MEKVGHFTWASNVSLSKYTKAKFAPYVGGDGMGLGGAVEVRNGYDIYIYIYMIYRHIIYIWNISPISIVYDYPLMIGTALPSAWRSSGYSPVINHGLLEDPPFRPWILKCHV